MSESQNPAAGSHAGPTQGEHQEGAGNQAGGAGLVSVWKEVRKRVFIKLPFSLAVADAMEAAVPIVFESDTFVLGYTARDFPLSNALVPDQVKNTIEGILRQAARRHVRLEVIEGTTLDEWEDIKERRRLAQEAVIAMAEREFSEQQVEDVLNQVISEIRHRISAQRDRSLPHVRAQLMLDIIPSFSDAIEMLFPDLETHDARRSVGRALDRISSFLDVPPINFAVEVERYRREHRGQRPTPAGRERTAEASRAAAAPGEGAAAS